MKDLLHRQQIVKDKNVTLKQTFFKPFVSAFTLKDYDLKIHLAERAMVDCLNFIYR